MVDDAAAAYYHWGWDIPASSIDGVGLLRILRPHNISINGSFGPDCFCQFDDTIYLYTQGSSGTVGINADAFLTRETVKSSYARAAYASGTAFSTLTPLQNTKLKNVQLLKADLSPIDTANAATFDGAGWVQINQWDGTYLRYKIFDVGIPGQRMARIAEISGAAGKTIIAFKTWTAAELTASPTRALQIDTVTDRYGKQMTFSYQTTQVAGNWVISSVSAAGGLQATYAYASDKLASVTYADGAVSTFTYGNDTLAHCNTITMDDQTADVGHRRKTIYLDDYSDTYGRTSYSFPLNSIKLIVNGNNEVTYLAVRNGGDEFHYEGGNRVKVVQLVPAGSYNREEYITYGYLQDGWTYQIDGNGKASFSGTIEPKFLRDLAYSSTKVVITDFEGVQKSFENVDNFITNVNYTDATFEAYCYNTRKQITRYRDRLGQVTRSDFNTLGQLVLLKTGLTDHPSNVVSGGYGTLGNYDRCATNDVATAAYAEESWTYVATGYPGAGLVASHTDTRGNTSNYVYDSAGRLYQELQPPDTTGGTRATVTYTYDSAGRIATITDPESNVTTLTYDLRGRLLSKTYPDLTKERWVYGTTGSEKGLLVRTIDRSGYVTTLTHDMSDRQISQVEAAFVKDSSDADVATPVGTALTTTIAYVDGSELVASQSVAGMLSDNTRDFKGRIVQTRTYPRAGKTLQTTKQYEKNQLYKSTDAYGRATYYAYDATDARLIRTVTATVPEYTPPAPTGGQTLSQALLAINRDASANAKYIVNDIVNDAEGQSLQQVDPRSTISKMVYDSRGRTTETLAAYGTALEAKTQTVYDSASNVTEVRSPRYFDSTDSNGYNKAKETWTYNGRNMVATHSEAPSTTEGATESFTYDLRGHQATKTDFRGKIWTMIEAGCCSLTRGTSNPLGNGSITNADPRGKAVHQITLASVTASSSNYNNPVDANTLMERTTRYDGRGRPIASTVWLTARGLIDTANPPIAGINGVASSDGLTTQYLYDDNLFDGVGLDNATGLSYTKMSSGTGTSTVSLSAAITKLADTIANGGAGLTFSATAAGRASVTINAEDEVSFSISDAAGRSVMSGQLANYKTGTGTQAANTLLTWSCQVHDATQSLSGYGTVLETCRVDATGKTSKAWSDAAGRTLRSIDQLAKVTTRTFDAAGNQLSVRDPNSVGQDCLYDVRGRDTQCTDTAGAVTKKDYDKAGNVIKQTDAKNKFTYITFDARGREKTSTDRINGVTTRNYLATGQLDTLNDAQNQTTTYTYDDAGVKLTEQYPDHTGGTPGQIAYGVITFTLDPASRVIVKRDQKGDTCKYIYDFAGRSTTHQYRTLANSPGGVPSGTISDTDSFTFDKASRMLTAVSGRYVNTVTYTYDQAGRKKTEALTISGKTYTTTTAYNTRGEVTGLTYPDGALVNRDYTDRGELWKVKHATVTIDTRTYDNGGRMTASTFNNGVAETRSYGSDNTLTAINFGGTGSAIGSLTYGWDVNKNKTSEVVSGTMSNYGFTIPTSGYDNEDRLVTYNRTSGLSQSWNLSTVGDWNSVITNGTAQNRTHGPTHELLNAAGLAVTTDVKGNITLIPAALRSNGQSLAITYDFNNRMVTADVGNNGSIEVSHKYDALGRRVSRTEASTTTVFALSGQQVICDYALGAAPAASTYRYLYASYIDEPIMRRATSGGAQLYYHRNQQYSIVAMTNSSGAVQERYAYTAYGVPTIANASGTVLTTSAINNRYMYTGREWDNVIGQYYYRARMYDAGLGRFCSRDPIGFEGSPWNLYEYCDSGSLDGLDPHGLWRWFGWFRKCPKKQPQTIDENCTQYCEMYSKANGGSPRDYAACLGFCVVFKNVGCDKLAEHCLKAGLNRNVCVELWLELCR